MENPLKHYLENTLLNKSIIENRIINPITKKNYPYRLAFSSLKKYADDFLNKGSEPRFISLVGLRGVGKTTLLWQIANHIYLKNIKNIYFFNVNILKILGVTLFEALEEFQKSILKSTFNQYNKPIILLFDEVQNDDDWSKTLKVLFDEAKSAFILCTGSSALLLTSTADLARRMRIEKIYPYKFTEFITAKSILENDNAPIYLDEHLSNNLKNILFYSESAESVFQQLKLQEINIESYYKNIYSIKNFDTNNLYQKYLHYQNIPNFLMYEDEYIVNDSILDLFKRVIFEDIPKINNQQNDSNKIEKLILRLAGSDEINIEKLSGIIGFKKTEIEVLIDILSKAELLNILFPYGGLDTKIMKNKKCFFMSPSLRKALLFSLYGQNLPELFKSKLIEDLVVMYLKRILTEGVLSFTTGSNESNPDFVIETRDMPILLEIGTNKTTLKQLKTTKIKYRYGILITDGIQQIELKDNCIYLPLNWFLLL
jgi:hypothetical protein